MGWLGKAIGTVAGGPIGYLAGDAYDREGDAKDEAQKQREAEAERQRKYEEEQRRMREQRRATSLNLLGQMQGPKQSDAQRRRIAALEAESAEGPLVNDALFQGDRARLVTGGQEALSSVQNTQRAAGTSGGFSNQGSINDVMDRLGAGLADLGQRSRAVKEEKRGLAADLQQAAVDAEIAYQNAQTNARIAIEQGDADMAMEYLREAYAAKEAIDRNYQAAVQEAENQRNKLIGSLAGGAVQAGGAILGKMPTGGAAAQAGGAAAGTYMTQTDAGMQQRYGNTYANQRRLYS